MRYLGGVKIKLHEFVTSALDGSEQSGLHSDNFTSNKMANDITWIATMATTCERCEGVAYFASYEEVLPPHYSVLYLPLDAIPHFRFVSVHIGAVYMSVASINGILDCSLHLSRFGLKILNKLPKS
jgi:hypothetical protein